jgi:hypothetical protein
LKELTIEQLRLLINQNVGLKYLVPKAIEILKGDVLANGDCYEGDLLNAVLTVEEQYWNEHEDVWKMLKEYIPAWKARLEGLNENNTHRHLLKTISSFGLK